jgi:hypothetical protein
VVSVLTAVPKGRRFKPGLRMGSKAGDPLSLDFTTCHRTLRSMIEMLRQLNFKDISRQLLASLLDVSAAESTGG